MACCNTKIITVGGGGGGGPYTLSNPNAYTTRITDSGSGNFFDIPIAQSVFADAGGDTSVTFIAGGGGAGGDRIDFTVDGVVIGGAEILAGGTPKWTFAGIVDPIVFAYTPQTTVQRDALTAAEGYTLYNSDTNTVQVFNGTIWEDLGGGDNLLSATGLTNTTAAAISHTDDFGFTLTGLGAKNLYYASGTNTSGFRSLNNRSVVTAGNGAATALLEAYQNGKLLLNSSIGDYEMTTAATIDSDPGLTTHFLTRTNTGAINMVVPNRVSTLAGAGAPSDGLTRAYYIGQIYIDSTTPASPVVYYATAQSTDPDAGAAGSTWEAFVTVPTETRDKLIPTAQDTIPDLSVVPETDAQVKFFINGVYDYENQISSVGTTVTVAGTIAATYGFNIETTDVVTAIYF